MQDQSAYAAPDGGSGDALVLAAALDMRAAGPLLAEVRRRRGSPLALDGSRVERLGGQCLQVLLATRAAWAADGRRLEILDPSTALKEAWALMGAGPLEPAQSLEFAP